MITRFRDFLGRTFGLLLFTVAIESQAQPILDTIPGPDDTGGMVMPMVSFDITGKSISVDLGQGSTITMYSLRDYRIWGGYPYANAYFNPDLAGSDWYEFLDPTRQHLPFSTRMGFEVNSGNASLLPEGSFVYIKATSVSSGLKVYDVGYWADVWEQEGGIDLWFQAFGEGNIGSTIGLDNIAAWGDRSSIKMWHPVVITDAAGTYSATFEVYLGDDYGNAIEEWSSSGEFTISWVAVPEPSTSLVLIFAGMALFASWRPRRRALASA